MATNCKDGYPILSYVFNVLTYVYKKHLSSVLDLPVSVFLVTQARI